MMYNSIVVFDAIREIYPVRDYWLCTILTLFRVKRYNDSIQVLQEDLRTLERAYLGKVRFDKIIEANLYLFLIDIA